MQSVSDSGGGAGQPEVEVLPAGREQQPVLANLMELYSHDFSEIVHLQPGPDGRFGYPHLELYWSEAGRHPFLIRADGELAGFALVTRGSRISGDPHTLDMAEFFVLRGLRKLGIGMAAALEVWRRMPGRWEVRVLPENRSALAFWAAAVREQTGTAAEPKLVGTDKEQWYVFSFVSRPA